MVFRPRLSFASVVNAMTVSAWPVFGVRSSVGGMRFRCGSIDVLSLHAATAREIEAAAATHLRPWLSPRTRALFIRVTFNGWLVGSDSSMRLELARRRR